MAGGDSVANAATPSRTVLPRSTATFESEPRLMRIKAERSQRTSSKFQRDRCWQPRRRLWIRNRNSTERPGRAPARRCTARATAPCREERPAEPSVAHESRARPRDQDGRQQQLARDRSLRRNVQWRRQLRLWERLGGAGGGLFPPRLARDSPRPPAECQRGRRPCPRRHRKRGPQARPSRSGCRPRTRAGRLRPPARAGAGALLSQGPRPDSAPAPPHRPGLVQAGTASGACRRPGRLAPRRGDWHRHRRR
mmetsp:Transcript_24193/g.77252  ORF Transcript_24193/g.77252 Transcript_24193/m.77252 type:complete len:252 (-) Transcript_24193:1372-2127(-)